MSRTRPPARRAARAASSSCSSPAGGPRRSSPTAGGPRRSRRPRPPSSPTGTSSAGASSWPASWSRPPGSSAICWWSTARSARCRCGATSPTSSSARRSRRARCSRRWSAPGRCSGSWSGRGLSAHAAEVALGWQGVTYGRHRAAAAARRRALRRAASALARCCTASCFLLVMLGARRWSSASTCLVGAIRWLDGRPAINSHARIHLGWLLVGPRAHPDVGIPAGAVRARRRTRRHRPTGRSGGRRPSWPPLLVGVALATALLSRRLGASRPRHALAAAGWIVLAARVARRGTGWCRPRWAAKGEPLAEPPDHGAVRAARLSASRRSARSRRPVLRRRTAPVVPSLWNRPIAAQAARRRFDGARVAGSGAADRRRAGRRPVWLGTRLLPGGRFVMTALADDRTGPGGRGAVLSPAGLGPIAGRFAAAATWGRARFTPGAPLPARPRRGRRASRSTRWPRRVTARLGAAGAGAVRAARARCPRRLASRRRPSGCGRLAPFAAVGRAGRRGSWMAS